MDKFGPEVRSKIMQSIKGKSTKIEVILAKALWHKGIRYRKNDRSVFGTPDISIKKYKIAIFVDGEFWHGKDWNENRIDTNKDFWNRKIKNNIARDELVNKTLGEQGWTVLRFWEKDVKNELGSCIDSIISIIPKNQLDI